MLSQADQEIWGASSKVLSRLQIIEHMVEYVNAHVANGGRAWHVYRHMLGLCNGLPGARQFRRYLSECVGKPDANGAQLIEAFAKVEIEAL